MAFIKNRVPYEVSIIGHDSKSGKRVSNVLHYVNVPATGGPYAYGDDLPLSDLHTFLTNFATGWRVNISANMSVGYILDQYVARSITSWQYSTQAHLVVGCLALIGGTTVQITTQTRHGFNVGDSCVCSGFTTAPTMNGTYTISAIASPVSFTINCPGVFATGYAGPNGYVNKLTGKPGLVYGDKDVIAGNGTTDNGQVAGEGLSLIDTLRVYKKSARAGKPFRGGMSLGPVPESLFINGTVLAASLAGLTTDIGTFGALQPGNGSSDATASLMQQIVFSKLLAFRQPTPWASQELWMGNVTGMVPRVNNGSMVRRKPRLTQSITQP